MNGRHDHTIAVCISLWSSGGLCVVKLPVSWEHGLCVRCVVSCDSTSFPWLVFFFGALLWESMIHKHTGRWMWQGSASGVSWNWEKYFCHSKLVSKANRNDCAVYWVLNCKHLINWSPVCSLKIEAGTMPRTKILKQLRERVKTGIRNLVWVVSVGVTVNWG